MKKIETYNLPAHDVVYKINAERITFLMLVYGKVTLRGIDLGETLKV